MELKVQADRAEITDGLHDGVIIGVEYRTEPYEYTDLVIEFGGYRLKAGYPTLLASKSKLGCMMARFGAQLIEGASIDIEKILIGEKCQFMTLKSGSYSNILPDSVKPIVPNKEEMKK